MKKILIHQHLGLGDHIVCNGLIREICKQNNDYYIAIKNHNFESVKYMFRDVPNLKCIPVIDDSEVIIKKRELNCELLKIGHEYFNQHLQFDQSFYHQLNIDFNKRWDSFYLQRDEAKEIEVYNKYNPPDDYIFVHDDEERNVKLSRLITGNKHVIKANKKITPNIFENLLLLEKAKEIHVMESSFLFICDSFNFKSKLFIHRYSRYIPPNFYPSLKNKWEIIT